MVKGNKGTIVLVRETWDIIVNVEKEDPDKQYIWLKIVNNEALLSRCLHVALSQKILEPIRREI